MSAAWTAIDFDTSFISVRNGIILRSSTVHGEALVFIPMSPGECQEFIAVHRPRK